MIKLYIGNITSLYDEIIFEEKCNEVGELRIEKIKNCKMKKNKVQSLGAGLLLQHAFQEYFFNNKPENLLNENKVAPKCECSDRVEHTESGKPFFIGNQPFFYNLSHSQEYVICGISDSPIGVDIQIVKEDKHQIAKKHFGIEEYNQIMQRENQVDQNELFTLCWSIKESYFKFTGTGIKMGLDCISVQLETLEWISTKKNQNILPFISCYDEIPNYKITLCNQEKLRKNDVIRVNW